MMANQTAELLKMFRDADPKMQQKVIDGFESQRPTCKACGQYMD